ncbi:hypothetical protein GCM10027031_04530 [Corynebacterium atrinae]
MGILLELGIRVKGSVHGGEAFLFTVRFWVRLRDLREVHLETSAYEWGEAWWEKECVFGNSNTPVPAGWGARH